MPELTKVTTGWGGEGRCPRDGKQNNDGGELHGDVKIILAKSSKKTTNVDVELRKREKKER